jgi:hypothetical protein
MDFAAPLAPRDRVLFLQGVAAQLDRYPEIGDGLVMRIARAAVKKYTGYAAGSGKRTKYDHRQSAAK